MTTTRGMRVRRRVWTTLAVAFSIFCSMMTVGLAGQSGNVPGWNVGLGCVLSLAGGIALIWRHERPWYVLAMTLIGPMFFATDASAALIALFAVSKVEQGKRLVAAASLVFVVCGISLTYDAFRSREFSVLTMGTTRPEDGGPVEQFDVALWIPWLVAATLVGIVVALSLLARTKSELVKAEHVRDMATEKTDVLREEMIRTEERTRIARDMHDTIAASLSRISLFAGGLQVNATDSPEKVANTAAMIRTTAHEALDELKSIVGVLRGTGARGEQRAHQGIDAIGEQVNGARAAGIHCRLESDLLPGEVGVLAGHVCYRVVQEALTNAQKYASDQMLLVSVTGSPHDGIRIQARNKLSDRPAMTTTGARSGLRGLAEQAREIGGKVEAGALGGDFLVTCWVPWSA